MKTVNRSMLDDLLGPLVGTADIDEQIYLYKNFDGNSERKVKKIIEERIKPHYQNASSGYKTSCKLSLSYFLTTNGIDFENLFDSCLIAFDPPKDARDFFLWIWQILFPDEDYWLKNYQNYIEIDDPKEPYNYWYNTR